MPRLAPSATALLEDLASEDLFADEFLDETRMVDPIDLADFARRTRNADMDDEPDTLAPITLPSRFLGGF